MLQPKVRHVIEEWQKRGIYTPKQIEEAGGQEYLCHGHDENVTPRASPGKLASLLSIIKQKKEEQGHFDGQQGIAPYKESHDVDRRQREETGAYPHHNYDEQRPPSHQTNRRDVGGIMGDAPGVPVGSGRIRRAPDDRSGDLNDRDAKKARESRWGPPRMDNSLSSIDRPAPILTSSDKESDNLSSSGRSGYSSQAPLLQSTHNAPPPRHDEWNGNAPLGSGWPPSDPLPAGNLGRHNAFSYEQSGGPRLPFPGSDDRRSPGTRIPGTSGEICRNFLAGRCTFGDRCWHIHDPQSHAGGPRPDLVDSRRKTVLCNNFPLGNCRFGDKCSFAHGEEELEKNAKVAPRHSMPADQASRWQASPSSRLAMAQPPPSYLPPPAPVPSSQARIYGGPQAVYNEPHGDRGLREGACNVSFANATAPGRRLPLEHQTGPLATPQVYAGAYAAPNNSTIMTPAPSYASNSNQAPVHVAGVPPVLPSSSCASQSHVGAAVPLLNPKVAAEDDDGETAEPEFTLEYDDDD